MFVNLLKNADYENKDGSWTRFPSQLWISDKVENQNAEQAVLLQYVAKVQELEEDIKKLKLIVEATEPFVILVKCSDCGKPRNRDYTCGFCKGE